MNTWRRATIVGFFLCGAWMPAVVQAADSAAGVIMEQAWVRAMPPSQRSTAAYLAVSNPGTEPLVIVGARTDMAEKAEIHVSKEVDGYTRMEQLERLTVPAGQTVQLSPGGIHLMLLGLKEPAKAGNSTKLCLAFSMGIEVCVEAPVQKDAGEHNQEHP